MKNIDNLSDKEVLEVFINLIDDLNDFISKINIESGPLSNQCKENITKIVNKTYTLTGGKGVQFSLWKYMDVILFLDRVVTAFKKLKMDIDKDLQAYLLLKLYSDVYELTLNFLLEFALVIAEKTQYVVPKK